MESSAETLLKFLRSSRALGLFLRSAAERHCARHADGHPQEHAHGHAEGDVEIRAERHAEALRSRCFSSRLFVFFVFSDNLFEIASFLALPRYAR